MTSSRAAVLLGFLSLAGPASGQAVEPLWSHALPVAGEPAFGRRRIYVETTEGPSPIAIDVTTGAIVWRGSTEAPSASAHRPLSVGVSRVYRVDAGGGLEVLDADSGRRLGALGPAGIEFSGAPSACRRLLLAAGQAGGEHALFAFDRIDGSLRWKLPFPPPVPGAVPRIAVRSHRVYLVAGNGRIAAIDPERGRVDWERRYDGLPAGTPDVRIPPDAIGTALVVQPPDDLAIRCLEDLDGALAWSRAAERAYAARGPGHPMIALGPGRVLVVDGENGRMLGHLPERVRPLGNGLSLDGSLWLPIAGRDDVLLLGWNPASPGDATLVPVAGPGGDLDLHLVAGVFVLVGPAGIAAFPPPAAAPAPRSAPPSVPAPELPPAPWRIPPSPRWTAVDRAAEVRRSGSESGDRIAAAAPLAVEARQRMLSGRVARAEALLREGSPVPALEALLRLYLEFRGERAALPSGNRVSIEGFVRIRLDVLFDLGGRDAALLEEALRALAPTPGDRAAIDSLLGR